MADVTRADIARFHGHLAATPYAANRALALLSKMFSLAEVWGVRPDNTNPCRRIERYREKSRERFLSQKDFAILGAVMADAEAGSLEVNGKTRRINPQAIQALRLMIFTGMRKGEVLSLRWEWVNWDAGRIELPDTKNNRGRHVHLSPAALEVLQRLERPTANRGFVIRGGTGNDPEVALVNVDNPWRHIRGAARLDKVRIHDLRHSFASVAVADGMSLPIIGALLGHRDVKTTARYAHLSADPLKTATSAVGVRISSAMGIRT